MNEPPSAWQMIGERHSLSSSRSSKQELVRWTSERLLHRKFAIGVAVGVGVGVTLRLRRPSSSSAEG